MPKKQLIGVVTSDKCDKTRRVEIKRLTRHAKYGKYIRSRTICHVHDEANDSNIGDTVEIIECPPRSKSKRWDLVRVVSKSQLVDIAAMRAAAKLEEARLAEIEAAQEKEPTTTAPAEPAATAPESAEQPAAEDSQS